MESRSGDEDTDFDPDSPEAKKVIEAIAKAFELDPALLGGGSEEPGWEDFPVEDVIGSADGLTQTIVQDDGTVVTTWNGGGSVAIP